MGEAHDPAAVLLAAWNPLIDCDAPLLLCDRAIVTMIEYAKVLRLALVPTILFFLLSLVSVALTTHYWIIGDWIVPRGVTVTTNELDQRTQRYLTDDTIVYFTYRDADATIVSGCMNLAAGVIALIAWSTLRKPGMDSQLAAVRKPAHSCSLYTADLL